MPGTSANVRNVRAPQPPRFARCRIRRPAFLAGGILAALCVLLVACGGDDDGIRISATTGTGSAATATPSATDSVPIEVTPTPLPVPDLPENPFASGRQVEAYLADGEADIEGCLPELVDEWDMAPEVDGVRCALLDLDGDRLDEFVFLVSFASGADDASPYPADLWFFEDEEAGYRFFNSARALANASTSALRIRNTDDLTSDGLPEVVMTWDECGASTCITHVTIASHHNGTLENLAPTDASIESIEEFAMDEGGVIRLEGGLVGSVGAGPQRPSTTYVRWAGARFRTEVIEGAPTYLVHLINDADRLFNAGSFAEAQAAYLEAAANTTLPDWKAEIGEAPGRPELHAYAVFRAAISEFKQSDLLGAGRLLERAATQYPETMHGSAAVEYLIALDGGAPPEEACTAAERFLDAFRTQYVEFWNYGYENPERTVFTLCR